MLERRAGWCFACLLLVGCQRSAAGDSAALAKSSAAPLAQPRLIAGEELSSPSAFELVASKGALHLVWAARRQSSGWLFDAELAHDGSLRRAPVALSVPGRALGKVTDLVATYVAESLAVAWLEQGAREARAEATLVGGGSPVLLDLGPAALVAESARGNLEIAAEVEQRRALVMWRGLEAPCVDSQASACVGFAFRRLRDGVAEPTGLPLSVPVPCASHSVALAVSGGRFHYGVCTREGAVPLTTMFTIQYRPEYARAEPVLRGCAPLGTIALGDRPWLVGDCRGKRKAAPLPFADERVDTESIDRPHISCTPERAELRQGRFVLTLREPRADLQAVLPVSFLPTGARAGWTGKSLVVAYVSGTKLQTQAFACQGGSLAPL